MTAEEKKMHKESTELESKLEELRHEKEQIAKMKQPKQLKTDTKVSVSSGK